LKFLKILLGAAGFLLLPLVCSPLPAAVTPDEAAGPGWVETLPESAASRLLSFPGNLTATPALFLPLVFKEYPPPPGVLWVLINNFLLFVPASL
jgi:hypothetical protein